MGIASLRPAEERETRRTAFPRAEMPSEHASGQIFCAAAEAFQGIDPGGVLLYGILQIFRQRAVELCGPLVFPQQCFEPFALSIKNIPLFRFSPGLPAVLVCGGRGKVYGIYASKKTMEAFFFNASRHSASAHLVMPAITGQAACTGKCASA